MPSQVVGVTENPLTRAKIELGRQLYFDPRLSADGTVSCASCHTPDEGFARHTQFGVGISGQIGGRNSPPSYNRILSGAQFWDGRAKSLEDQAVGPIANPIEMGNTHEECVTSIKKSPVYQKEFRAVFGELTIDAVAKAIASFERTLVTGPSPYDYEERLRPFADVDIDELKEDDPELYQKYLSYKEAAEAASDVGECRGAAAIFSSAPREVARPATSAQISPTKSTTTWAWAWTRTTKSRSSVARPCPRTTRIGAPSKRRRSATSNTRLPTCTTAARRLWKKWSSGMPRGAIPTRTSTKKSRNSILPIKTNKTWWHFSRHVAATSPRSSAADFLSSRATGRA